MAVKVRLGNGTRRYDEDGAPVVTETPLWQRAVKAMLILVLACLVLFCIVFGFYYFKYQHIVDDRLNNGPLFASTAQVYAAPMEIRPGQKMTVDYIAANLHRSGYNLNPQLGTYRISGDSISISPGPQSYHSSDGATVTTDGTAITRISADNGAELRSYELEPQLITALSEDKNRTKRRIITYNDIPPRMVSAVTAIEDRRFFEHNGINFGRIAECAVQDLTTGRKECGGSTLTMQLARGFFLTPDKRLTRKFQEIIITLQLESRFNKEQIFTMYANQINLGQRGSFAINGFGEAAQAYFGKNLKQLDTAQCALLAGMIQRPNYFNPYRHPERAVERRNIVLRSMVETGALTQAQAQAAEAEPLHLATQDVDASEAPYFVDLVHDQINQRMGEGAVSRTGALRIYTSLDPDLQTAATEAVQAGMRNVDEQIRRLHRGGEPGQLPQVALVAINPHTGQVLALVGGRNYGVSQLNHAVAERPTGSIFKPFVYATAEMDAVNGQPLPGAVDADGNQTSGGLFTAVTILHDDPTTFTFDNGRQRYTPRNYKGEFHGDVTAIYALAHSLNNATISLGQIVGFENVAALARASGIVNAKGTPAVALGSYDATPLDMAGAYTVFANGGVHLKPWMLSSVRDDRGDVVADFTPEAHQVMDPKAAYLTQSLLQGVMNFGYGYEVRKRGFTAPAAGKTGTSRDAWFEAYSSNLICVVWVGYDDYSDVKLTGAVLAAPIWAEFMNRAIRLPQYSDMKEFTPVSGVSNYRLDKTTNLLADESCPNDYTAAFLDGTQPLNSCSRMGEDNRSLVQKIFGLGGGSPNNGPVQGNPGGYGQPAQPQRPPQASTAPGSSPEPTPAVPPPHRNFFQKIFGGGKKDNPQNPPQ